MEVECTTIEENILNSRLVVSEFAFYRSFDHVMRILVLRKNHGSTKHIRTILSKRCIEAKKLKCMYKKTILNNNNKYLVAVKIIVFFEKRIMSSYV